MKLNSVNIKDSSQFLGQIYFLASIRVRDQVYNQVCAQVWTQVYNQVIDQTYGQFYET